MESNPSFIFFVPFEKKFIIFPILPDTELTASPTLPNVDTNELTFSLTCEVELEICCVLAVSLSYPLVFISGVLTFKLGMLPKLKAEEL